jgi:hypothetical protein
MSPIHLQALAGHWLELSRDYRPSAFWFWNDELEPEQMRRRFAAMAAAELREVLFHPVHGMTVEYLSTAYFDRLRFALGLAREHGIKVWIYDEFAWPSGVAGGLLLREHPEHRGWHLKFSRCPDGTAQATPTRSERVLDAVAGAPWTRGESGYLDTLSAPAVRCFLEMTYERTRREGGDLFREVVTGFFTDEPAAMIASFAEQPSFWTAAALPWTPELPRRFQERFGYDIAPHYAELAGDGPNQKKDDYWLLVKEMHSEAYHGQLGRWCREHQLRYTGHLGEDVPLQQVRFAGSPFQCLRHMDLPGIDFLGCGPEPEQRFGEYALVSSIARHAGRAGVYCEAFGISPFDLRLGEMQRRVEIMSLQGVTDVALMGFHQSLHGIRKHAYWPPIFQEAPWWPFYGEFHDAAARATALAALGRPQARYALLYPQYLLEQIDVFFADIYGGQDPASQMIKQLAAAIHAAGETFAFVFPEILAQAEATTTGGIRFPHAEYAALSAPADVPFSPDSRRELDRLAAAGARILRQPVGEQAAALAAAPPSWHGRLDLQCAAPAGSLRVFRFAYPDGELFALRNVTDQPLAATLQPGLQAAGATFAVWEPVTGRVTLLPPTAAAWNWRPHTTRYFTLTATPLPATAGPRPQATDDDATPAGGIPVSDFHVQTPAGRSNLAHLRQAEFRRPDGTWVPTPAGEAGGFSRLPVAFFGATAVEFRAEFACGGAVPADLAVLFEAAHLTRLSINGRPVELAAASPATGWDASCRRAEIAPLAVPGVNRVEAVLAFAAFETSLRNEAFFINQPMPSADLCLAGAFRGLDGRLEADPGTLLPLPLELGAAGWPEYHGLLHLAATVTVPAGTAENIRTLELEMVAEDAVEAWLDGHLLGRCVTWPYRFEINALTAGTHQLELRLAGTSANLLGRPAPWGLRAARLA